MDIDKNLIYNQLKKIKESPHLNKSKISCDLLDYLVKSTLNGDNPKEYTIGIELFGEKYADEGKQDSKIRVYIYNLRKKLKSYYESDGIKDPIIFEIEKGKYKVNFTTRERLRSLNRNNYKIAFLISCTIILGLTPFLFTNSKTTNNSWQKLPIWKKFANNDKPILLVLGDYYVFSGTLPTGNIGIYRDFDINSEVDYEHLLDKQPELVQVINKSSLTYLSKMSVFCQNDIQRVFSKLGKDVQIKLSSDIQPDDLKDYNIIFIGNYKNMGLFENIIKELQFSFGISNNSSQYIYSTTPNAPIYTPANNNLKENDYALVVSTKGYSDNHYLLFISAQDIGNISTVHQFSTPEYLKQLYEENQEAISNGYFKALFRVEGINKTDLAFELISIE